MLLDGWLLGPISRSVRDPPRGFSVLVPGRDYVTLSENKNQHVCRRVHKIKLRFLVFGMWPASRVEVFGNGHRVDEDSWVDDRAWVDILRPIPV